MAIPFHGSQWSGHLLTLSIAAPCALAVGCQPPHRESAEPNSPAAPAALAPLAQALIAPAADPGAGRDAARAALEEPDLAPFDSRSWYVLLVGGDGAVRAVRQRFDRVLLASASSDADVPRSDVDAARSRATVAAARDAARSSAWRFDALMLASGARSVGAMGEDGPGTRPGRETSASPGREGVASGAVHHWQQAQRVALGLANAAASQEAALGVLTHRLDYEPGASACEGRFRLSGTGTGSIEVHQRQCPIKSIAAGATLARVDSGPMVASSPDGARGVAWQRRLIGALPTLGGAVRFDIASLTLRGVGTLELLRSRRSSGRGVPVVTARLLDRDGWQPIEAVAWSMPTDGRPERIDIDSLAVAVTLSRIALPGEAGALPDPVDWRGVVLVTGSHDGAGFLELAPSGERDERI